MTPFKKVIIALSFMVSLLVIGTGGYMLLEGYVFIDALYMAVITLGTVGYREVAPLSDAGKLFTIFLIIAGIGSVAYAVTQAIEYFISTIVFKRKRMERSIAKLTGHVILCGYGRIGRQVATQLAARGVRFVVIEHDPDVIEILDGMGFLYVQGNATDDEALRKGGIDDASTVVATLPTNADNVYVTLSVRNLNRDIRIVARAGDAASSNKLLQAGADKVISPYELGGRYIANSVVRPHVVNFMDVVSAARDESTQNLEIESLQVTDSCVYANKALRDTDIRAELNIIVLAIKKADGEFEYNPSPDTVLETGAMLICIGFAHHLDRLATLLGVGKE